MSAKQKLNPYSNRSIINCDFIDYVSGLAAIVKKMQDIFKDGGHTTSFRINF